MRRNVFDAIRTPRIALAKHSVQRACFTRGRVFRLLKLECTRVAHVVLKGPAFALAQTAKHAAVNHVVEFFAALTQAQHAIKDALTFAVGAAIR